MYDRGGLRQHFNESTAKVDLIPVSISRPQFHGDLSCVDRAELKLRTTENI